MDCLLYYRRVVRRRNLTRQSAYFRQNSSSLNFRKVRREPEIASSKHHACSWLMTMALYCRRQAGFPPPLPILRLAIAHTWAYGRTDQMIGFADIVDSYSRTQVVPYWRSRIHPMTNVSSWTLFCLCKWQRCPIWHQDCALSRFDKGCDWPSVVPLHSVWPWEEGGAQT